MADSHSVYEIARALNGLATKVGEFAAASNNDNLAKAVNRFTELKAKEGVVIMCHGPIPDQIYSLPAVPAVIFPNSSRDVICPRYGGLNSRCRLAVNDDYVDAHPNLKKLAEDIGECPYFWKP